MAKQRQIIQESLERLGGLYGVIGDTITERLGGLVRDSNDFGDVIQNAVLAAACYDLTGKTDEEVVSFTVYKSRAAYYKLTHDRRTELLIMTRDYADDLQTEEE